MKEVVDLYKSIARVGNRLDVNHMIDVCKMSHETQANGTFLLIQRNVRERIIATLK
jgi:hypothetical protein